jgi:hypothetical protein
MVPMSAAHEFTTLPPTSEILAHVLQRQAERKTIRELPRPAHGKEEVRVVERPSRRQRLELCRVVERRAQRRHLHAQAAAQERRRHGEEQRLVVDVRRPLGVRQVDAALLQERQTRRVPVHRGGVVGDRGERFPHGHGPGALADLQERQHRRGDALLAHLLGLNGRGAARGQEQPGQDARPAHQNVTSNPSRKLRPAP